MANTVNTLNGSVLPSHASTKKELTFTRNKNDLNDASVTCLLIEEVCDQKITLTTGNEITNTTNTAATQIFDLEITASAKQLLLGDKARVDVDYAISLTIPSSLPSTDDDDSNYTGTFQIIRTH